jgi:hypothetical protein
VSLRFLIFKRGELSGAPVTHACIPSYSGGRDQEDCGLKPAQANSSCDPHLKKTLHKKRAGGVAQGVGPELELQYHKKKNLKKGKTEAGCGGTCL